MDFEKEVKNRVEWIKGVLAQSGASGLVFGASGGKDSALVGVLCKMACDNTLGVIMPCGSAQNYADDKDHALLLEKIYNIEHKIVDLTSSKTEISQAIGLDLINPPIKACAKICKDFSLHDKEVSDDVPPKGHEEESTQTGSEKDCKDCTRFSWGVNKYIYFTIFARK